MTRRHIPSADLDRDKDEDKDALPGGAPGIPEEEVVAAPVPVKLPVHDPVEIAKLPPPKLYRVARGGPVVYQGVPTTMKAGKTLSEATHDLHTLRIQGIILEEIPLEK